jgi:hypothetical protein
MIRAIGSSGRCTSVDRLPETSRERARQIEARANGRVHDACEQEASSAYLHNIHSISRSVRQPPASAGAVRGALSTVWPGCVRRRAGWSERSHPERSDALRW